MRLHPTAAGWLAASVIRIVACTLRFRFDDRAGVFDQRASQQPILWVCWHNRIFLASAMYWRHMPHRRGAVLTSASRDGEILARTAHFLGLRSIRGSSSRRRIAAIRGSAEALAQGFDLCITPDGPRGPRYLLQPGPLHVARLAAAPIVPLHFRPHRCWRLRSWDHFIIPVPFSRVDVTFDRPIVPPEEESADSFESARAELEEVLRLGTGETDPPSPDA